MCTIIVWLVLWTSLWARPSECIIILWHIHRLPSKQNGSDIPQPCWQHCNRDVDVFTGNAACSRGGRNGFIFTPACFITSEAFLDRLIKGKAEEADSSFYRHPASVPPDNGNQTTASEIYIPELIWSFWLSLFFFPQRHPATSLMFEFLLLLLSNCLSED